jgi:hypothetical protein
MWIIHTNSWCTASMYSHFFSSIWQMQNIWSVVDFLCQNPHQWSPIISSAYGVNLESRMLDKILYVLDNIDMPPLLLQSVLSPYRIFPFLRQFLLIPNRNNKFMDLIANCSAPCFNQFCWVLINTRWSVAFELSVVISSSEAVGSGTCGSAVCISVCPPSLTPCTFSSW